MSTLFRKTLQPSGVPGIFTLFPSETALWASIALKAWWGTKGGDLLSLQNKILDRKFRTPLEGSGSFLPVREDDYWSGLAADTSPLTAASSEVSDIDPTADWSVFILARHGGGAAASSTALSFLGDGGGQLALRVRNGDLFQVLTYTYSSGFTASTPISETVTTTDWHLYVLGYDQSEQKLNLKIDGQQVVEVLSWTPPANMVGRVCLLGAADLTVIEDIGLTGRDVHVAEAGVFDSYIFGQDEETALQGVISDLHPGKVTFS